MIALLGTSRARRRRLAARAAPGPMRAFYAAAPPDGRTDWRLAEFIALDLETTGLDARRDEIVSVGWVAIDGGTLDLSRRGHRMARPTAHVSAESAVIHKIFDTALETAPPIGEVLDAVIPLLAGRVLVCHHARIERAFLDAACRARYGVPFEAPVVDTMELERRRMRAADHQAKPGELRLDAVRRRYNLPRYHAHNALMDAVAAGELFLAQMHHRAHPRGIPLRDVWSW